MRDLNEFLHGQLEFTELAPNFGFITCHRGTIQNIYSDTNNTLAAILLKNVFRYDGSLWVPLHKLYNLNINLTNLNTPNNTIRTEYTLQEKDFMPADNAQAVEQILGEEHTLSLRKWQYTFFRHDHHTLLNQDGEYEQRPMPQYPKYRSIDAT